MAKKYNPTPTNRVEGFVNFLNNNKIGTFLENATITGTYYTMTIALIQSTISIKTQKSVNSTEYFIKLTDGVNNINWGELVSEQSTELSGMLLSNNGIIIKITNRTYTQYISIFVDSNNKLSFVYNSDTVYSSDYTQYVGVSTSSINQNPTIITPQFNATLTSLALITPTTGDINIYFPNMYVAVSTQLPGIGMYIVTINDTVYITNGIWYIPD